MGMAHCGMGEFAEADPYLRDATTGDAQNLPLRLVMAHSYLWSKQYQCVLNVDHEILTLNAELAETAQQRPGWLECLHLPARGSLSSRREGIPRGRRQGNSPGDIGV
jgi:hypothetical protein